MSRPPAHLSGLRPEIPVDRDIRGPAVPAARGASRRDFLRGLAALGAGGVLASVLPPAERALAKSAGVAFPATSFPDGVMAGDPRPDRSVIHTRVTAAPGTGRVPLLWLVALDAEMQQIVAGGIVWARERDGFSLNHRVEGLLPDRWYHYQFRGPGAVSDVGRIRTSPPRDQPADRLRYAFCSCQQRGAFYVAHRSMAAEDLDFFMHLGDYIYVSDGGTITLDDYRARWRTFQSNPELQALQARLPIVAMFDDGEFYNGVDSEGPPARLEAGRRAWHEAMPVRRNRRDQVYRRFSWGDVADVFMIDVRTYRDPEVPANDAIIGFDTQNTALPGVEGMFAPGRTTLGAEQKAWLEKRLTTSRAAWKLIGNPYNFGPWKLLDNDTPAIRENPPPDFIPNQGTYVSNEAWDDYGAERRELLELIRDRGIDNVVFTSGHTHFYLTTELMPDYDEPGAPSVAADFVTGSLTADPHWSDFISPPNPTLLRGIEDLFLLNNDPYLKYVNMFDQGYAIVDVTPEELIVEYKVIESLDPDAVARTGARFRMVNGSNTIETLFDERPIERIPPGG